MALDPRLLVELALGVRVEPGVDQLDEVLVLHRAARGLEAEPILERGELDVLGQLVGRGEQDAQLDRHRLAVLVELALVDDREQRVQDRRVRLEDLVEEHQPRGRQLAVLAAQVAAVAQLGDVDRPEDLGRLGEPREHVLEVLTVGDPQRVLELEDEVALRGARRADQQQRLLRDRGDAHQVDQRLLGDEEPAERGAEPVDPIAQPGGLARELVEREPRDAADRVAGSLQIAESRWMNGLAVKRPPRSRCRRRRIRCSSSSTNRRPASPSARSSEAMPSTSDSTKWSTDRQ